MALDAEITQSLLKKLAEDQRRYNDTLLRVEALLSKSLETSTAAAAVNPSLLLAANSTATTSAKSAARILSETQAAAAAVNGGAGPRGGAGATARRSTGTTLSTLEVESVKKNSKGSIVSSGTGDDEEDEDDEDDDNDDDDGEGDETEQKERKERKRATMFAAETLPTEVYDEDGLRAHVRKYPWTAAGQTILGDSLLSDGTMWRKGGKMWPTQVEEARERGKHLPYYNILDVGADGAPLPILLEQPSTSRAKDIWDRIKHVNADPKRERKAVGRITIVHEPSPLLFAALHYTMSPHFDVDELFQLLVDTKTDAFPHRPFSLDKKHRKTFVWTMEYFTIVGEDCKPMSWQRADENIAEADSHIPVTRCSSVIALSLASDTPMRQIRNKARRQDRKYGDVYDPFAPWHVLNIQAYADWRSTISTHSPSKHYVNGPEAFLVTLRTEFKDAQKRLREVYKRISELVSTPPDFMFRQSVRDKLLFEDDEFTYSRRYFWAYQSLAIMNEDIQEMISAYRHSFAENVWNGSDKIIWPGDESSPERYKHWRKRMASIREDIETQIRGLELIDRLNDEKMKEIKSLRDNLFSGTSVLESRRSVQQQAITVQQGHNIKILTLVTIFFLPLTFVTSVFGMTNMNPNDTFVPFGVVTACICFPTYLLILSLNTTRGLQFWARGPVAVLAYVREAFVSFLTGLGLKEAAKKIAHKDQLSRTNMAVDPMVTNHSKKSRHSWSTSEHMTMREGLGGLEPTMANTVSLTPAVTMERNTTIQFDVVKPAKVTEDDNAGYASSIAAGGHIMFGADGEKPQREERTAAGRKEKKRHSSYGDRGWMSQVLGWRSKKKKAGNQGSRLDAGISQKEVEQENV